MAVSKLQSSVQCQAIDQVVVAGQVRIDAMQSAERLAPASLPPQWLPAATLAGLDPFTDQPDPFGLNPNGSRAGRSVSIAASRPERGRLSKFPRESTFVAARHTAGGCYRPALAG
jgi:hypothetical protein